jgi:enoyl-CoA hydratase/carnithine racemase
MLTHFDFVYAGESAKFQMPFVNLALVPEFGASYSVPAQLGYVAAAELILLGSPFDAKAGWARIRDAGSCLTRPCWPWRGRQQTS